MKHFLSTMYCMICGVLVEEHLYIDWIIFFWLVFGSHGVEHISVV